MINSLTRATLPDHSLALSYHITNSNDQPIVIPGYGLVEHGKTVVVVNGMICFDEKLWLACANAADLVNVLTGLLPVTFVAPDSGKLGKLHVGRIDGFAERDRRLFACALCRLLIGKHVNCISALTAISVAERYVDGQATIGELRHARELAHMAANGQRGIHWLAAEACKEHGPTSFFGDYGDWSGKACDVLRDIVGNPFRPVVPDDKDDAEGDAGMPRCQCRTTAEDRRPVVCHDDYRVRCESCQRIWAPFFQRWNDSQVFAMANAIYNDRCYDDMPILGDALESAGCTNVDVLAHCRSGKIHVRGCFVLDAIFGKGLKVMECADPRQTVLPRQEMR